MYEIGSTVEVSSFDVEGVIVGKEVGPDGLNYYSVSALGIYGYLDAVSEGDIILLDLPPVEEVDL